jgi:hypothetical protein
MRLTPHMEGALRAMTRGELRFAADIGWQSPDGLWNSHTIRWLAGRGLVAINGSRARITSDGIAALGPQMMTA